MSYFGDHVRNRKEYFSAFIVAIFLGMLSCAITLLLVLNSYLESFGVEWKARIYFAGSLVFCTLQVVSGAMVLRGYVRWSGGLVFLFLVCLFVALPALFYHSSFLLYVIALCCPLMGLYYLNTRRYRSMLAAAADFRLSRRSVTAPSMKNSKQGALSSGDQCSSQSKMTIDQKRSLKKIECPIGALLVALLMGVAGYLICESVMSGVVMVGGKTGPLQRYSLVDQPRMFWFAIFMYSLLIVVGGAFLRFMYLLGNTEFKDEN